MEHVDRIERPGRPRELRRWLQTQFDAPVYILAGGRLLGDAPGEDVPPDVADALIVAASAATEVSLWTAGHPGAGWLLLPGIWFEDGPAVAAVDFTGSRGEIPPGPAPALLAWGRETLTRLRDRFEPPGLLGRDVPGWLLRSDGGAGVRFASQLLRRVRVSEAPSRFQRFVLERAAELVPGRLLAWIPIDEAEPILHVGMPTASIGPRVPEALARLRRAGLPGASPDPDGPRFETFCPPGDRNEGRLLVLLKSQESRIQGEAAELLGTVASAIASQRANSRIYSDLKELLTGVIRALTAAIDAKDSYTSGHSERVARIATRLAEELGLGEEKRSELYLMGILHDIGKIGIDDKILKKQEELTPDEYREIQEHVEIGVKILSDLKTLRHLLPGVAHHHESYDGSGYPDQLAGEQIPFEARILAVADAFDAMSSSRPYRPRLSPPRIASVFQNDKGGQWDPRVVAALLNCWKEIESIQEKGLGESLMRVVSTTVGRGAGLRYPRGQPS